MYRIGLGVPLLLDPPAAPLKKSEAETIAKILRHFLKNSDNVFGLFSLRGARKREGKGKVSLSLIVYF